MAEEAARVKKGEPKIEIEVNGKRYDKDGQLLDETEPDHESELAPHADDKGKTGPEKRKGPAGDGAAAAKQKKNKADKKDAKDKAEPAGPPTTLLTVPAMQFLKWDKAARTVQVHPDLAKELEGKVARHKDGLASAIDNVTMEELDRKDDRVTVNIAVTLRVVELPAKLPKNYPWKIGDTRTESSSWQLNLATGKGGQLDFSTSIPAQFRALLVKTGGTYAVKSGGGVVKAAGATLKLTRVAGQAERVEGGKTWVDLVIEVSVTKAAEGAAIVSATGEIIPLKAGTTAQIPLSYVDQ